MTDEDAPEGTRLAPTPTPPEVGIDSWDGAKEFEALLARRWKLKATRDIFRARCRGKSRDEKLRLVDLVTEWARAQGRLEALEYDERRLRVELAIAKARGSKGLVEVNEKLIAQTRDNLAECSPRAEAALTELNEALGTVDCASA
jgi:seryl-tRNA synthetase